jgi:arylsulfatase A-like enzyme
VSDDGRSVSFGHSDADYQTDVLGQHVVDTIERFEGDDAPWFISFTPLAPHVGRAEGAPPGGGSFFAEPAPRHARRATTKPDERAILLENGSQDGGGNGVRVGRWAYFAQGQRESLFDLRADPAELHNLSADPTHADTLRAVRGATDQLATCAGASCWVTVPRSG